MTPTETKFLIGMVAGWAMTAVLSYQLIIAERPVPECPAPVPKESPVPPSPPERVFTAPSSMRAPSAPSSPAASEPEPAPAYVSESEMEPPSQPDPADGAINPLTAISATQEELDKISELRGEYSEALFELLKAYEGDELKEKVRALSEANYARIEEVLGEERAAILAEETRRYAIAAGYGDKLTDEQWQTADQLVSDDE